ncbi:hypothetical protein CBW65_09750 [Tumebacillus avium]|uniref:Uncharacterized protein n=1 Tax=Tumebacillus avium TaxID=1903704 RepID=A0A1Y0IP12_9BACL|nr:hypothetical protein [Tumebacillus avium]ARU61245.1 hypothetical protein CBW65_09750 [Tumebacillus avium]
MQLHDPSLIKPFFQILTYQTSEGEFDEPAFRQLLQEQFNASHRGHVYGFISDPLPYRPFENTVVYLISHKSYPSWLRTEHRTTETMDSETDLLILYSEQSYLFVHSTCSNISKMVANCLQPNYRKLNYREYAKILSSQYNIQFKSLGIKNIFGAGGMAPESKAYFGKDTKQTLSYTADSGYGMKYFLGTRTLVEDGDPETLGCSPQKNKLWGGWAENLQDFVDRCREIVMQLELGDGQFGLDVLVQPTEPVEAQSAVAFYLDYSVEKKGFVLLGTDQIELTPHWDVSLLPDPQKIRVRFNDDDAQIADISLTRHPDGTAWVFSTNHEQTVMMQFSAEDPLELEVFNGRRARDLIAYLNENQNFTMLFEGGIAFRDGEYYKDNRYTRPFQASKSDLIDWANVDLRKESSPPSPPYTKNISTAVEEHLCQQNPLVGINDDGANEAADFVCVTRGKYILVHAKYSADTNPGLRVGDVQVVISQAIKNLRFFTSTSFQSNTLSRWSDRQFYQALQQDELTERLFDAVENKMVDKECWIVQPGISRVQLEDDPENKIHCLLNHMDAICKMRNIKFRFICSP